MSSAPFETHPERAWIKALAKVDKSGTSTQPASPYSGLLRSETEGAFVMNAKSGLTVTFSA